MRTAPLPALARVLLAALGIGAPIAGAAIASCGTDAVGVEACREIEAARCEAIPVCPETDPDNPFDAEKCKRFYSDECLVGIEYPDAGPPSDDQTAACVKAIEAVAACVKKNIAAEACTGAPLVSTATTDAGPPDLCGILKYSPEKLAACAFVAAPPGSTTADAGTNADAGDMDAADGAD